MQIDSKYATMNKKIKGGTNMATHILVEDILDEMINQVSYIKLNTYIKLSKNR